jgi:hypothetical protein
MSNAAAWAHIKRTILGLINTPGEFVPIKTIQLRTSTVLRVDMEAELALAITDGRLLHLAGQFPGEGKVALPSGAPSKP